MSDEKSPTASSSGTDLEKQDNQKNCESESNEPLEKAKEKRPPGINASLVLLYAVFFSMFTTGVVNIMNCPVCIFIPIYLIVAGSVGALAKFLSKSNNKHLFNIAIALVVFDVIWHGVGSYFVYKKYPPSYDPTSPNYCNSMTFFLAFWVITFQYTILGFFILLSALYMLIRGEISFE